MNRSGISWISPTSRADTIARRAHGDRGAGDLLALLPPAHWVDHPRDVPDMTCCSWCEERGV